MSVMGIFRQLAVRSVVKFDPKSVGLFSGVQQTTFENAACRRYRRVGAVTRRSEWPFMRQGPRSRAKCKSRIHCVVFYCRKQGVIRNDLLSF